MHDDELDRFKRDINLVEYASGLGYRRVPRESSRASHLLRSDTRADKIVVTRQADGHWVYCSVHDARDHGTILDFLQHRERASLGQIRATLRQWLGTPRPDPGPERRPETPPVARDPLAVVQAFGAAEVATRSFYLQGRGLRPETLTSERFAGTWKVDRRGNVLFAHTDDEGLTGFEIKSVGFTGFARGGRKALWQSAALAEDTRLVITESAIDALSYHQLHGGRGARYVSTGGAIGHDQAALLTRVIERLVPAGAVIAAVDADRGGDLLATTLEGLARAAKRPLERHSPTPAHGVKDWNDVLQKLERNTLRSVPPVARTTALERGR